MQQVLTWLEPYLAQLERLPNVGDDVVVTFGTILAALLATLAAIIGWYFTGLRERRLERLQRERALKDQADLRKERINDIVRAIHAEILAGIVQSERQLTDDEIRYAINDTSPFATPDDTDFVFDSIKSELSILPSSVIHDVVCYYRVLLQSNLMVRDLRSEEFGLQQVEERRRYIVGFLTVLQILRDRGHQALEKLEAYGREQGFGPALTEAKMHVTTSTNASIKRVKDIYAEFHPPQAPLAI